MRKKELLKKVLGITITAALLGNSCVGPILAEEMVTEGLSFTEQNNSINIIAKFDTSDLQVISRGIVMAKTTGELTMNTPGRYRVTFSSTEADGSCLFTVPATVEMRNTMFRAFWITRESDGKEKILYSNQETPAQYFEINKEVVIDNIRYRKIENGFEVLGVDEPVSVLMVPQSVRGETVVKIAESAFENDTVLTEADLPNTIQIIGKRAFAGCTSLKIMK